MGIVLGILVAVVTVPAALLALMQDSNWETGEGGSPVAGGVTLALGWMLAAGIIATHFYPIHLGW